jgi:hypothetical protein
MAANGANIVITLTHGSLSLSLAISLHVRPWALGTLLGALPSLESGVTAVRPAAHHPARFAP